MNKSLMAHALFGIPTPIQPSVKHEPFQMVGVLKTNNNKQETDILEAITSVSSGAQVLFIAIKRGRDFVNNFAYYEPPEDMQDTKSHKYTVFRRNIRYLKQAKLLIDVPAKIKRKYKLSKKGMYFFINPNLIYCKEATEAKLLWRSLTK